jgi:hypothetical protein
MFPTSHISIFVCFLCSVFNFFGRFIDFVFHFLFFSRTIHVPLLVT